MGMYQRQFIELALEHQALGFGEFTLKSGRTSPYFFNAGRFQTGRALAELGRCYAQAPVSSGVPADLVFGPAYKGIPLAATTAIALAVIFRLFSIVRSEEHTSELQSRGHLVCRLLLDEKKTLDMAPP